MNSTDLIKKELKLLSSLIDDIEIRHEFKKSISTHLIEIKPLDLFSQNRLYIDKEIELEERFAELFPNEDLVFISEDSLCKIEKPDLILHPFNISYKQEKESFCFADDLLNNFVDELYNENNYALAA